MYIAYNICIRVYICMSVRVCAVYKPIQMHVGLIYHILPQTYTPMCKSVQYKYIKANEGIKQSNL